MRVVVQARPWSLNERRHWRDRNRDVQQWQMLAGASARRTPIAQRPVGPQIVVARSTYTNRRFDVLNDADAVKAIVDGVVNAGILRNDSPRYIAAAVILPPRLGRVDRVDVGFVPADPTLIAQLESILDGNPPQAHHA